MLQLQRLQPRGLQPLDLALGPGECVAVRGPSGSGKTLLLRAIADLDPCPGEVRLDGVPRSSVDGPAWRRQVMYLAADSGWWSSRVEDHFEDWPAQVERAVALGLAADCGDWPVDRLSTGERQRLALLRALEPGPRVLLLDEPTSGLDPDAIAAVERLLDGLRRDGVTLLWVTHDPAQAARVSGRRISLSGGRAIAA